MSNCLTRAVPEPLFTVTLSLGKANLEAHKNTPFSKPVDIVETARGANAATSCSVVVLRTRTDPHLPFWRVFGEDNQRILI